jgi:hypothetical protein
VPAGTDSLTVTAQAEGGGAAITVNGVAAASGAASDLIALQTGDNSVSVSVLAQDGTTRKTYTVTVIRAPAPDSVKAGSPDAQNTLVVLALTGDLTGTVADPDAFALSADSLQAEARPDRAEIDGSSLRLNFSNLTVAQSDHPALSYAPTGTNDLTNGSPVSGFDDLSVSVYSDNADLAALSVKQSAQSSELLTGFASATTGYEVPVSSSVESVLVTASSDMEAATVTIVGVAGGTHTVSGNISLTIGDNDVTVSVRSPILAVQKEYRINIVRAPAPVSAQAQSQEAGTLVTVTMNGALSGSSADEAAFTMVSGALPNAVFPNSAVVSGRTIALYFPVDVGDLGQDTVISYAPTGTNDLTNGSLVDAFSNLQVSVSTSPPSPSATN